jgi:hypothetical protein
MSTWSILLSRNLSFVDSAKAYPAVGPQNAKLICVLGDVCSATVQLPTSAILSEGLEKLGKNAVASGGLADTWEGKYRGGQVAIKAFHLVKQSEMVKEVCIQSA